MTGLLEVVWHGGIATEGEHSKGLLLAPRDSANGFAVLMEENAYDRPTSTGRRLARCPNLDEQEEGV